MLLIPLCVSGILLLLTAPPVLPHLAAASHHHHSAHQTVPPHPHGSPPALAKALVDNVKHLLAKAEHLAKNLESHPAKHHTRIGEAVHLVNGNVEKEVRRLEQLVAMLGGSNVSGLGDRKSSKPKMEAKFTTTL